MPLLSRDQILDAADLPHEDVPCPEWGGDVRIFAMMGDERERFENLFAGKVGTEREGMARWCVALTAGDENGNRLFTVEDVARLGKKSGAALLRCAAVALRLGGFSTKDVEDLAKN